MVVQAAPIEVNTLDQHVGRHDKPTLQHGRVVAHADYDSVAKTGNFRDQPDHLMLW